MRKAGQCNLVTGVPSLSVDKRGAGPGCLAETCTAQFPFLQSRAFYVRDAPRESDRFQQWLASRWLDYLDPLAAPSEVEPNAKGFCLSVDAEDK